MFGAKKNSEMKKLRANKILLVNPLFDAAMRVLRPTKPEKSFRMLKKFDLEKIAEQSIFYLPRPALIEIKIAAKPKGKLPLEKTGYPIIQVPTAFGCLHRCVQCGFSEARLPLKPEESLKVAKIAIDRVVTAGAKYFHVMWLSGLEDLGMPPIYMEKLLKYIKKYSRQIIEVETEGRPDQLQDAKMVKDLKRAIGPKIGFVIGIGVESSDDRLMSGILNRGTNRAQVVKAIGNLKENGIGCLAHVMSHLPILTEFESIINAKRTIKDLFSLDTPPDMVILMALNLQQNTLVWLMEKEGYWQHPSIWGYFKILKELPENYREKVHIGGFATEGNSALKYLEAETEEITQDAYRALVEFERSSKDKSRDIKIITALLKKYQEQYAAWENQQKMIEKNKKPLLSRLVETCQWVANHEMFGNSPEVQKAAKEFLPKISKIYQGAGDYLTGSSN